MGEIAFPPFFERVLGPILSPQKQDLEAITMSFFPLVRRGSKR